ncbi:MAG: hypothetical protein QW356_07815 [Candidatus Hadarchaeales archaeon]
MRKRKTRENLQVEEGKILANDLKIIGYGSQWQVLLVNGKLIPDDGSKPRSGWFLVEIGIDGRGQYSTLLSELDTIFDEKNR